MADEPIDVEPERILEEANEPPKKSVDIDEMSGDALVQKEIELQRSKSKFGRFQYNEAKELASIQRRLYGSPKVNMPKKPQTPFEYNKNMERYAPIMPRARSRSYGMEVRGRTNAESVKRFDRNKGRQHRLRSKLRNVDGKKKRKKRGRKKKKSKEDKDEEDKKR